MQPPCLRILFGAAALLLLSCRPAKPPAVAPVPDRSQRLELNVPEESPLSESTIADFLDQIGCLIGSNGRQAELCADENTRENVPLCTTKAAEMAAPFRAVFVALPSIELTTLDSALVTIPRLLPGFETTRYVNDARRTVRCDTWGSEPGDDRPRKCLGLRSGQVWLLLSGAPGPRSRVDRVEVFLGVPTVCEDAMRPGEHA